MLSRSVPVNRKASCGTTPSWRRKAAQVEVAHVEPVDGHPARGGVVEPGHQLHEGGLARPGLADERHRLARGDVQVDAGQGLVAHGVAGSGSARPRRPPRPAAGRARRGAAGAGVPVVVAISSSIRSIDAAACCHVSNTWDSCWIGAKNWSRYSTKAITTPVVTCVALDQHRPDAEHRGGPQLGEEQHEREVEGDHLLGAEPGHRGSRRSRRGRSTISRSSRA